MAEFGLSVEDFQRLAVPERQLLAQRVAAVREVIPQLSLVGQTVVIVDDGVATGMDARAACRVARRRGAAQIVLAVPVAPEGWRFRMHSEADRFFSVVECAEFYAVGQFYDEFLPVSDEEFLTMLKDARGLAHV